MDHRYAQLVDQYVSEFMEKVAGIHSPQVIPIASTKTFENRLKSASNAFELNRAFWSDQLNVMEVWRSTFAWRMRELLDGSVLLRKNSALIASAPILRSAFELAQESLVTSAVLSKAINSIEAGALHKKVCIFEEVITYLEIALYGTTIKERTKNAGAPRPPRLAKARSVLQSQKLGGEISKFYERLSDLSHPYWLGNRPFYRVSKDGTVETTSSQYDPDWQTEVALDIDSVLAWTAKAGSNVLDQTFVGITKMRTALSTQEFVKANLDSQT